MSGLQRAGGLAAAVQAIAYAAGFALFVVVLSPPGQAGSGERLAFLVANRRAMEGAMLVTYVLPGIATVVLAVALHERSRARAPAPSAVAAAFGLIWGGLLLASGMVAVTGIGAVAELHGRDPAGAGALWRAVGVVQDGLGGGNEIVGGIWVGLIGWAALRTGGLPGTLGRAGVAIGAVGVLTAVPGLGSLTDLFGIAMIPWFAALGWAMLREG